MALGEQPAFLLLLPALVLSAIVAPLVWRGRQADTEPRPNPTPTRPIIFWIATLAAVIAVVVLLRRVLLPFVAGIALAYLLSPIANRIERLGISRGWRHFPFSSLSLL